jgi:hypothetical protein
MMNGIAQVLCMNMSKDRRIVAYCSSCREDRGILLEGLQLGVSLSLMARTPMEKISMISNIVIIEE